LKPDLSGASDLLSRVNLWPMVRRRGNDGAIFGEALSAFINCVETFTANLE
jgi:hypothetical protein